MTSLTQPLIYHRCARPPQAPWLELKDYPKQSTAELVARRAGALPALDGWHPATARPFRLLTTHLAPAAHWTDGALGSPASHAGRLARLPLREEVKYVVSVSNGEVAARGAFAFANGHSRRWARAWGGFPRRHDNLTLFLEVRGGGRLGLAQAAALGLERREVDVCVHDAGVLFGGFSTHNPPVAAGHPRLGVRTSLLPCVGRFGLGGPAWGRNWAPELRAKLARIAGSAVFNNTIRSGELCSAEG